jgi:hypothetical protein
MEQDLSVLPSALTACLPDLKMVIIKTRNSVGSVEVKSFFLLL